MPNLINKHILNETRKDLKERLVDIINDINNKCKPFVREWLREYNNKTLEIWYSGRYGKDSHYEGVIRTERTPLNMDKDVHYRLDDIFFSKFGVKYRSNSIFVTGDASEAGEYGKIYLIFPIGKYQYTWSPSINDLYLFSDILGGDDQTRIDGLMRGYKQKDLSRAISSHHEIMLSGKQYIALRAKIYNNVILNWFEMHGTTEATIELIKTSWDDLTRIR